MSHCIHIKSISHLFNMSNHRGDNDKRFCPICSQMVPLKDYAAHICKCYKFAKESTCIKLPEEETFMKFKSVSYADTECSLLPTNDANKVEKHVVNSACFYCVCNCDHTQNRMWSHVGEDSVHEMIIERSALADERIEKMKTSRDGDDRRRPRGL